MSNRAVIILIVILVAFFIYLFVTPHQALESSPYAY